MLLNLKVVEIKASKDFGTKTITVQPDTSLYLEVEIYEDELQIEEEGTKISISGIQMIFNGLEATFEKNQF